MKFKVGDTIFRNDYDVTCKIVDIIKLKDDIFWMEYGQDVIDCYVLKDLTYCASNYNNYNMEASEADRIFTLVFDPNKLLKEIL